MFRRIVIISSLVLTLATTVAFGQAGRQRQRPGAPARQRVERVQRQLNLNETQRNALRALRETRRREMDSLREEMRTSNTITVREARERRQQIAERFQSGARGVLTPEQQQQLENRRPRNRRLR